MATDNPSVPSHLEPSELGTKEYWDSLYTTEIQNHASNPADRGTVWFDDSDAEAKLIEFLEDQTTTTTSEPEPEAETEAEAEHTCNNNNNNNNNNSNRLPSPSSLNRETTSLLDLGCGNGSLLFSLRAEGWRGPALGVDYSEKSIALARQIAGGGSEEEDKEEDKEEEEEEEEKVAFLVWDVLNSSYETILAGAQADGWDVVLDKGTFDAISLSEERNADGRRICEGYKGRVIKLVRKGGLFLVTSCNWTEEELEGWFGQGSGAVDGASFVRVGRVTYPSFSFGGVKGQTISTLCFQRT